MDAGKSPVSYPGGTVLLQPAVRGCPNGCTVRWDVGSDGLWDFEADSLTAFRLELPDRICTLTCVVEVQGREGEIGRDSMLIFCVIPFEIQILNSCTMFYAGDTVRMRVMPHPSVPFSNLAWRQIGTIKAERISDSDYLPSFVLPPAGNRIDFLFLACMQNGDTLLDTIGFDVAHSRSVLHELLVFAGEDGNHAEPRQAIHYQYDSTGAVVGTETRGFRENARPGYEWQESFAYARGNPSSSIIRRPEGTILGRYEFAYDSLGRRASETYCDAQGKRVNTRMFEHNATGQCMRETLVDPNGQLLVFEEYEFNENGLPSQKDCSDPDGTLIGRVVYIYESGFLTSEKSLGADGRCFVTKTYHYRALARVIAPN